MSHRDDLLEKAFQLAYFIISDRSLAIRVVTGAMDKFRTHRGRETKRFYWRDKHLKRGITRISKDDQDTLQWLVCFESDAYEKRQEQFTRPTVTTMVVRYIKTLVRITTGMSSFYVNVGLQRLLFNYTTTETQQMYESATERFPGADVYRRAKGLLMDKLEERFGRFLKTVKTEHGEIRFQPSPHQSLWRDLLRKCLTMFTPWSTADACLVPANLDPASGLLSQLLSTAALGRDELGSDVIEMNRCHVFIEPTCFGRLTKALGLDPPEDRLAVPWFDMRNNDGENNPENPPLAAPLTDGERMTIRNTLSSRAERRRKFSPQFLSILVDGTERARLDLKQFDGRQIEIQEGAQVIEVWSQDKNVDVLLATHLIPYNEWEGIACSTATVRVSGRKSLALSVSPTTISEGGARGAIVSLQYLAESRLRWSDFKAVLSPRLTVLAASALAASFLLGWSLSALWYRRQLTLQRVALEKVENQLALGRSDQDSLRSLRNEGQGAGTAYRLIPDDTAVRGRAASRTTSISLPGQCSVLNLEISLPKEKHTRYRAVLKPFLKDDEMLSQTLLSHTEGGSESRVTFSVPSCLLEPNKDYSLNLWYITPIGRLEEVNSYTFHVSAKKD